jgi:hypothetical protein
VLNFAPAGKETLVTLPLPAGSYVIVAKAWIENDAGTGESSVECDLTAEGDFDRGTVALQEQGLSGAEDGIMHLQVVHTFAGAGASTLDCVNNGGGSTRARFVKVTAIQVGALTNAPQ